MDEAVYLKILEDLASINYKGVITYSRYNEPLADKIILKRIQQARDMVPEAILYTHTNGDYLDRDYLGELKAAGLNTLRVQAYLGNNEKFADEKIKTRLIRQIEKLDYPYQFTIEEPNVRYMAALDFPGMEVTFDARNFDEIGVDRGQTIKLHKKYERTSPCLIVYKHMYIDHDGSVVPCCNIRSDEPSHKNYVIDKVSEDKSIFEIYANSALADWRKDLLTYGKKKKPCDTCAYETLPNTAELQEGVAHIAKLCGFS
jgi:radical SAM protein with 4Fe4S-binding SPASM domain